MRKVVTAVVVTVAAVAGPGLPGGAAGATARAPEVSGIGVGGAVTHARPLVRVSSPGVSRALASSGDRLWLRRFHPPVPGCGFYFARSVAVSPGGDAVFVTGFCGLSRVDYFTVAYNAATGATLWMRRYGPPDTPDQAESVAVSPGGDAVYVTGASTGASSGQDYFTVAYDAATGATLWGKRYNGPANGDDAAAAVAVSPGGQAVYVTGVSAGGASGQDYATAAYDAATGATLWVSRYNGPGNGDDAAAAVAVSPGGQAVYVTGVSAGGASGQDYATAAYDAATGATLWVSRYNGPGNGTDAAGSLAVSPSTGTVYVTGHSDGGTSGADYLTAAYDAATGAKLWVRRYNGPGPGTGPFSGDFAASVAVSPGGGTVYVTGGSYGAASHLDYATVAYDAATGATLWGKRYNGPPNGDDSATSVAVSPSGGTVYVTGESLGFNAPGFGGSPDFLTAAYNAATGATLWVRRYNGPAMSGDVATSIAVSPSTGTVFVTGDSNDDPSGSDIVTIAYSG